MDKHSFLILKQSGNLNKIFESDDVPIFWLTLITQDDLDKLGKNLERLENGENVDPTIAVNKARALELAKSRRDYIAEYFPKSAKLFDDWRGFISKEESSDNMLYINLTEASKACPLVGEFVENLTKTLSGMDKGAQAGSMDEKELIYLTGRAYGENSSKFAKYSETYKKITDNEMKKSPGAPQKQSKLMRAFFAVFFIIGFGILIVGFAKSCSSGKTDEAVSTGTAKTETVQGFSGIFCDKDGRFITPTEKTNFTPSSTLTGSSMQSFTGTIVTKPDVGLGAVGTNTL